jgi:hypothetical protein
VTEPSDPAPASALEIAVAVHLAAFVIGVSWAFGGNADWVRTPISIWGSLGIVLTVAGLAWARPAGPVRREALGWAWPILALNALVAASCLTPGMTALQFQGQTLFMPARVAWWIPSTTRADLALRALWLFDGIYFSCLNLALVASRRRTIRFLLAAAAVNAVALAVFGTVQRLVGAPGLYFGAVPSPQEAFFASFVYDNHWGAFALLSLGALAGLTLRSLGRRGAGLFRGPAFGGWVAAVLIGLSIPLSGSRACSLLLALMAALAAVQGFPRMARALKLSSGGPRTALALAGAVAALSIAGAWMVAGDAIQARTAKTREQLGAM